VTPSVFRLSRRSMLVDPSISENRNVTVPDGKPELPTSSQGRVTPRRYQPPDQEALVQNVVRMTRKPGADRVAEGRPDLREERRSLPRSNTGVGTAIHLLRSGKCCPVSDQPAGLCGCTGRPSNSQKML
jgi:hypothetical protein